MGIHASKPRVPGGGDNKSSSGWFKKHSSTSNASSNSKVFPDASASKGSRWKLTSGEHVPAKSFRTLTSDVATMSGTTVATQASEPEYQSAVSRVEGAKADSQVTVSISSLPTLKEADPKEVELPHLNLNQPMQMRDVITLAAFGIPVADHETILEHTDSVALPQASDDSLNDAVTYLLGGSSDIQQYGRRRRMSLPTEILLPPTPDGGNDKPRNSTARRRNASEDNESSQVSFAINDTEAPPPLGRAIRRRSTTGGAARSHHPYAPAPPPKSILKRPPPIAARAPKDLYGFTTATTSIRQHFIGDDPTAHRQQEPPTESDSSLTQAFSTSCSLGGSLAGSQPSFPSAPSLSRCRVQIETSAAAVHAVEEGSLPSFVVRANSADVEDVVEAEHEELVKWLEENGVAWACESGRVVFGRGEEGSCAYYLSVGTVEVITGDVEGTEWFIIADVRLSGPTEFFGELAVLFDLPRTATVKTLVACEGIRLSRALVEAMTATFPATGKRLVALAKARLEELDRTKASRGRKRSMLADTQHLFGHALQGEISLESRGC
ncbi:hypothetical protein HK101_008729 [Irineochytrium annulatum]|nr:hypothetical protein HK101_008729 [Irineochytrium annulatum]